MERPQTKNKTLNSILMLQECLLHKKGFIFNYLGCENDSVSCDSEFVLSELTDFLREKKIIQLTLVQTIILSHPGVNWLLESKMLKLLASISLIMIY